MNKQKEIERLLKENEMLWQIIDEVYGEDFLNSEAFWSSPTQEQLRLNIEALVMFGYDFAQQATVSVDELLDAIDIEDVLAEINAA